MGERFVLSLKWTHPERWRLLDKIDLRLVDEEGTVILVRFDEAANTFGVFDQNSDRFSPGALPGNRRPLQTNAAVMYPEFSSVIGSGPTGPDVTINYDLRFKPLAAGRTFRVEVSASDDAGNQQEFENVGTVTVAP